MYCREEPHGGQKTSNYTRRAKGETAIARWKRVIGDGLRAHTEERRVTDVNVAVLALNHMLAPGRPSYVRNQLTPTGSGLLRLRAWSLHHSQSCHRSPMACISAAILIVAKLENVSETA